jgi:hypothetical protein
MTGDDVSTSLTNYWNDQRGRGAIVVGGIAMANLTFRCPQTGRTIESGIVTDPRSLSNVQAVKLRLTCPHCGKIHGLLIKDGHLCEAA